MTSDEPRRATVPILYTRGTHYEVGYDIGRTFQCNIETFLSHNQHLNNVLLEKYQSDKVRWHYEKILESMEESYPQYVDELKGIANGAKVPFFKLFLMHIDDFVSNLCAKEPYGGLMGSTSICCDEPSKVILGHSQDFASDAVNLSYIVHAHVLESRPRGKWGSAEEKFTAFCLPGMLPGLYMGYNSHGLVFSVNAISTGKLVIGSTPRHFLCRAMLSCSNMFEVCEILNDEGAGISDGVSVLMTFVDLLPAGVSTGNVLIHNAEAAPPNATRRGSYDSSVREQFKVEDRESQMSVLTLSPGESLTHCNKFLRLKVKQSDQLPLWSSNHRHQVLKLMPRVSSFSNVVAILGDQTDLMYSFFRDGSGKDDARTVAVGIFNLTKKTWSIYTNNPKTHQPVVVLPLVFK